MIKLSTVHVMPNFVRSRCNRTSNVRNWQQSEICIVINNKSQGSITKHLRCDELLYYTLITQSPDERIFKIGEHLAKLQAKND